MSLPAFLCDGDMLKNVFFSITLSVFALLTVGHAMADTPIVQVGDRVITKEEIQKIANSMPLGDTRAGVNERDMGRLFLEIFNETINSELLFIEAQRAGVFKWPEFKSRFSEFRESSLADLRREKLFEEKVDVTQKDVTKLSEEKRISERNARAVALASERNKALSAELDRLFDVYGVTFTSAVAQKAVAQLKDSDLLVSGKNFKIFLGDIKDAFSNFGSGKRDLIDLLSQKVEVKLLAMEAEKMNLDVDETFRSSIDEYRKSLAVNLYREKFEKDNRPSEKEIGEFVKANPGLLYYPQEATALMIVTKTKEEAEEVRRRAIAGENFFELAIEKSIAPDAKANAGRIGPIRMGDRPYNTVDLALLKIKPGQVTEPIQGTQGFSIFKLIDITEKKSRSAQEARKMAEQTNIQNRMTAYLNKLRSSGMVKSLVEKKEGGKASP